VETVLRNLVDNAYQAVREQPEERRHLVVKGSPDKQGVLLEVHDTGVGIAETIASKIFTPFFTTKGVGGTGLGLGLSRKLTRLYGGELVFTSEENVGTVFELRLPRGNKPGVGVS
jgi:signal transduction histidine kinase